MAVNVVHVITTLETGGAETMLFKLLLHWPRESAITHHVVSLTGMGAYGGKLSALGVRVTPLNMPSGRVNIRGLGRLYSIFKKARADIVQTWLYHADLLGLIMGKMAGVPRLAWNVRCSRMDLGRYPWPTRLVFSLLIRLSRIPDVVIVNSAAGRVYHETAGYRPRRWQVLPNGFDTDLFRPDPEAGKILRRQLGIEETSAVIGMVARFDPMKAHEAFFEAAGKILKLLPGIRFVLVGEGMTMSNAAVRSLVKTYGMEKNVCLLGHRDDLHWIYPAFDLHTLASAFGEGFPNVIGEAMACGVPCVVTDVGDAARIIQDTGMVVPPSDPEALSRAWKKVLDQIPGTRAALGRRARDRIVKYYTISEIVKKYNLLYDRLCAE